MTTYRISLPRRDAALYLAWELGIRHAVKRLATVEADPLLRGFVFLPCGALWNERSRRSAQRWANRIRMAVAYQQGRLGRPLGGNDVLVRTV